MGKQEEHTASRLSFRPDIDSTYSTYRIIGDVFPDGRVPSVTVWVRTGGHDPPREMDEYTEMIGRLGVPRTGRFYSLRYAAARGCLSAVRKPSCPEA